MLCQQNHFCHFSWTVVFLTAFPVQTRCAWIKVPLLAGRVIFCYKSFSKRGIYSHQITLNLFYTWTNMVPTNYWKAPGSLYPIIEIIRLIGRPQPQMYPPVALNHYTSNGSTELIDIFNICFKAPWKFRDMKCSRSDSRPMLGLPRVTL